MGKKIVIVGPAHPYRGGIAAFSERLARELQAEGHDVSMMTFTLQYPSFLFPGKTQFSSSPAPEGLSITRKLNSINPFNWIRTGLWLRRQHADVIIYAFWLPYMAPATGTIARIARRRTTTGIGLVHNLIPHERKFTDRLFARYFCGSVDRFVTLSDSVRKDLEGFSSKACEVSPHPVYDNFGQAVPREDACRRLGLDEGKTILLSFGLIRDYKGLDLLLEAFADERIDKGKVCLVVAGEFYSGEQKYHDLAASLGIDKTVVWRSEFIADEDVKLYFSAADLVVQPYRSATQSGVTQIAYNFLRPMLVSNVGGLPEMVPDGVCGYVVEPEPKAISDAIVRFFQQRPDFSAGLKEQLKKYSWEQFCKKTV